MEVEQLLARLDGVRASGRNRWVARCPAHKDKSPSLGITRGDRVPILMHCFAGCDVQSIASALGIELHELMPERDGRADGSRDGEADRRPQRDAFNAWQALRAIDDDVALLYQCAHEIQRGNKLPERLRERIAKAASNISEARRVCNA